MSNLRQFVPRITSQQVHCLDEMQFLNATAGGSTGLEIVQLLALEMRGSLATACISSSQLVSCLSVFE